ncbi:hypothetical protein E1264_42435 [Actinomadura sp. KC216]|uniref:hypothetical protein n=1 Tax=Actinomadura sp. KC216 TaxID=2530370 RepID=UPI00104EA0DC|nr:hypothetical protein [Actinomadura sp. KC216]TDB71443.1 hypothetical protein E1264_42435 [Actinomadura sp. KC216]
MAAAHDDPLERSEFLVIGYNSRDASLTVLNNMGYSERNRHDAVQDAMAAAEDARSRGLPLRYVVVRVSTEAVFPPERR